VQHLDVIFELSFQVLLSKRLSCPMLRTMMFNQSIVTHSLYRAFDGVTVDFGYSNCSISLQCLLCKYQRFSLKNIGW